MSTVASTGFQNPADYITARQRAHPPQYQQTAQQWNGLFGVALELSPSALKAKAGRGSIASGEVGELAPAACVTAVGHGYAVEMSSGMMRLIYSAARAMTATDSGQFRSGQATTALSAVQAAEKVADLFKNYSDHEVATAQQFPATAAQQSWAHAIAVHAETFLLMHELAHVHNEHSFWSFLKPRGEVYAMEVAADAAASRWLIEYVVRPKPGMPHPQMLYAGAEFALRVRMAMETVGMKFETTHPKAGDRVAALRSALRGGVGERDFFRIASTALALDQMWRAIEQLLLGRPPVFKVTADDVLSSMRTVVVEMLVDGPDALMKAHNVPGQAGQVQVVLSPTDPHKVAMINSARDYMRGVTLEVRDSARARAGDVFEQGSVEFSLLSGFLNSV